MDTVRALEDSGVPAHSTNAGLDTGSTRALDAQLAKTQQQQQSWLLNNLRRLQDLMLSYIDTQVAVQEEELRLPTWAEGGSRVAWVVSIRHREAAMRAQRDLASRSSLHDTDVAKLRDTLREQAITIATHERQFAALQSSADAEIKALNGASDSSIDYLKKAAKRYQALAEQIREQKDAEIAANKKEHESTVDMLQDTIATLHTEAGHRRQWIMGLQDEIEEWEKKHAAYVKMHEAYEKRKQQEIKELHAWVKREIEIKERYMNWTASLKQEVAKLEEEMEAQRVRYEQLLEEAAREQARLRREIWRRDETGRRLRVDVAYATEFFLETMVGLAGFDIVINTTMTDCGVVAALGGFTRASRPRVAALAVRALGRSAWNGNGDVPVVNILARQGWMAWVDRCSKEEIDRRATIFQAEQRQQAQDEAEQQRQAAGSGSGERDPNAPPAEPGVAGTSGERGLVFRESANQGVVVGFESALGGEDAELEEDSAEIASRTKAARQKAAKPVAFVQVVQLSVIEQPSVTDATNAAQDLAAKGGGLRQSGGEPRAMDLDAFPESLLREVAGLKEDDELTPGARIMAARSLKAVPSRQAPHPANQHIVARQQGTITRVVELCQHDEVSVVQNASDALTIMALSYVQKSCVCASCPAALTLSVLFIVLCERTGRPTESSWVTSKS